MAHPESGTDDSTRTLVIRQPHDEIRDLYLDGAYITSITTEEFGLNGSGVVEVVRALGKAFAADVVEEDVR